MLLKNTSESGVIENHVNDIYCEFVKKARLFIPTKIHTLSQKYKRLKVPICQNSMDVLSGYGVKLKK